jgi:hypothetical protein
MRWIISVSPRPVRVPMAFRYSQERIEDAIKVVVKMRDARRQRPYTVRYDSSGKENF